MSLNCRIQGPRSKFLSGGAKLDEFFFARGIFFFGGGEGVNSWEFSFNFSKVTENAFITIKLLIYSFNKCIKT